MYVAVFIVGKYTFLGHPEVFLTSEVGVMAERQRHGRASAAYITGWQPEVHLVVDSLQFSQLLHNPVLGMAPAWYDRFTNWKVENLFARPPPRPTRRSIYINQELPLDYFDGKGRIKKEHVYITNQVVTSKYTIITFLPRNLLEQFRRVANV